MEVIALKCSKCGSTHNYVVDAGVHAGLYCSDCGAWLKWVSRKDKDTQNIKVVSKSEHERMHKYGKNKDRVSFIDDDNFHTHRMICDQTGWTTKRVDGRLECCGVDTSTLGSIVNFCPICGRWIV